MLTPTLTKETVYENDSNVRDMVNSQSQKQ